MSVDNIVGLVLALLLTVFLVAALMNFVVVALALFVLRPLRFAQARAASVGLAAAEPGASR